MLSWRKNAPDQIPLADESTECILEFAGIQPRIISSSKLIDFRTIRFLAIGDATHRNHDRVNIGVYSMVGGSLKVPGGKSLSSMVPSGKRHTAA